MLFPPQNGSAEVPQNQAQSQGILPQQQNNGIRHFGV
jgi:hypothetical protein